jgi:hypothetical protein
MTTDFGRKLSNTDNWLKVSSKDHVRAHLLEDHVSHEKVVRLSLCAENTLIVFLRSIDSIMNAFQSWRTSRALVFSPTTPEKSRSFYVFGPFKATAAALILCVTFKASSSSYSLRKAIRILLAGATCLWRERSGGSRSGCPPELRQCRFMWHCLCWEWPRAREVHRDFLRTYCQPQLLAARVEWPQLYGHRVESWPAKLRMACSIKEYAL